MILSLLALLATVDPSGIVALYGRGTMGHACPISAEQAFTAEHVSSDGEEFKRQPVPLVYSKNNQEAGVVLEIEADRARDLSRVQVIKGDKFPVWYPVAEKAPEKGDRVVLVGYDFDAGATPLVVEAKVKHVDGPHLTYDKTGGPGSSGSCVLNERGELVGLNVGAFVGGYKVIGRAMSVWGRWQEFLVPESVPQILEFFVGQP